MRYLTEKNIMWAAIAVLALSSYSLHNGSEGQRHNVRRDSGRMEQMRTRMGSRWDGMSRKEEGKAKKEEGRQRHSNKK